MDAVFTSENHLYFLRKLTCVQATGASLQLLVTSASLYATAHWDNRTNTGAVNRCNKLWCLKYQAVMERHTHLRLAILSNKNIFGNTAMPKSSCCVSLGGMDGGRYGSSVSS